MTVSAMIVLPSFGGFRGTGIYFEEVLDLAWSHIENLLIKVGREAQRMPCPVAAK
jgi:hypothetical protein